MKADWKLGNELGNEVNKSRDTFPRLYVIFAGPVRTETDHLEKYPGQKLQSAELNIINARYTNCLRKQR